MYRRFPTAILLIAAFSSTTTSAAGEPVRAPIASVSLGGGFSFRDTQYLAGGEQRQTTRILGASPTLLRLGADWFPIQWLGLEGEGRGDFFQAIRRETELRVDSASARGLVRLGASVRIVTPSGFVLNGSLGYGAWWSPVILTSSGASPRAFSLASNGPIARVGLGYAGDRFEGLAGLMALFTAGQQVNGLEPQLWLAGRVADLGPTALWVGLDAGFLLEQSANTAQYGGPTLRFALGVKLQLLPPKPPPRAILEGPDASKTTLQVEVVLAGGAPAAGALVTVDSFAPTPVDAQGQLIMESTPARHRVTAKLAGYRPAVGEVTTREGKATLLSLQLESLTGPGQLTGIVRTSATGKPISEATVTVGGAAPVQTTAQGTYRVASVGPGPVKVRVEAQGFAPADEVAQVPPESEATLDVQLEPLGKGSPATVRGLVRSATGEPLKASVAVTGVKLKGPSTKVEVTAEGRFFVTVPGGTYQFVISAPGYVTQSKKVVLADGDQAIVHSELQKVSR